MKWSIQQLRKLPTPYHFSDTIDFSEWIKSVDDIISIDKVEVTGVISKIDEETFRFVYQFVANMELQCALTLRPVPYVIDLTCDEVYSKVDSDDYFLIEKNTFDLDEMVWTNILLEKPINVTLPNAHEILKSEGVVLDDTEGQDIDDEEDLFYSNGIEEDKN